MKTYTTRNNLTMIKSTPYNWELQLNPYGRNKYATIFVGSLSVGHTFIYDMEENIVHINHSREDSGPAISFSVWSIEDAGKLVHSFVVATKQQKNMEGTIYTTKME